jgi:type II secretory ATPase GspE/PulE/Tfp pilus assembly ATPase PilB-like protein
MAQRLVRRICTSCKILVDPDERTQALFKSFNLPLVQIARGEGCAHCGHAGFSGRAGIYELFMINDRLRDIITTDPSLSPLKKEAHDQGHLFLAYDGLCKVAEGLTTLDEVTRVVEMEQ